MATGLWPWLWLQVPLAVAGDDPMRCRLLQSIGAEMTNTQCDGALLSGRVSSSATVNCNLVCCLAVAVKHAAGQKYSVALELPPGAGLASARVYVYLLSVRCHSPRLHTRGRFPNIAYPHTHPALASSPASASVAMSTYAAAAVSRRLFATMSAPLAHSLMAGAVRLALSDRPAPKAAWLACAVSRTKHDSGLGAKQFVPSQTAAAKHSSSSLEGPPCSTERRPCRLRPSPFSTAYYPLLDRHRRHLCRPSSLRLYYTSNVLINA